MLIRLIDMNPFSRMFWRGVGIVSVAGNSVRDLVPGRAGKVLSRDRMNRAC
jgi:hypothetical protein